MSIAQRKRITSGMIQIGLVALALAIWLAVMRDFRLDDSFITYRYARHAAEGVGLVYNAGEPVLSTTAPLYALMLAAGSWVIPDFHLLGGLIGAISIGLGAAALSSLLPASAPVWVRLWTGVVYASAAPLWLALGMETPLWILLVLLALRLAQAERWSASGLLMGAAVLCRPDAGLPGLLLAGAALVASLVRIGARRRWWEPLVSFGLAAALPVMAFYGWAWTAYGSPIPATFNAKNAQAELGITGFGPHVTVMEGLARIGASLLGHSLLYLAFVPLAVAGFAGRVSASTALVMLWGLLHLLAYVAMQIAPYRWYYAPLAPGLILLAATGLMWMAQRVPRSAAMLLAGLALAAQIVSFVRIQDVMAHGGANEAMLPIVDWQAYREAGEWLAAHTPEDALIGVAEVGQLGFYAQRTMTDYLGLLQPAVADLLRRDDLYSWLVGYQPDYLVFQRYGGRTGLALYNRFIEFDPWFASSYREVAKFDDPRYVLGPVVIYQRQTPSRPLREWALDVDYDYLRLVGLAVEEPLTAGPGRVRLDWEVAGALPPQVQIAVALLDTPERVQFDGGYNTRHWSGRLSTWHSLVLPEHTQPGMYPVWISVGVIDGRYVQRTAAEAQVSAEG